MKNSNENYRDNNVTEKKIIIYLITLSLILIYFSLFFIHNIIDNLAIKNTQSIIITYPESDDPENNDLENDNSGNDNPENNDQEKDNQENNNSENKNSNDVNNSNNTTNGEENIVNNSDRFRVMQGTKEWSELKELDIFKNSYFNNEAIIAPGVYGNYSFTVENYGNTAMEYSMIFNEENIYNINMVYRLKLNGSYIAGNEEKWVKYGELSKENLIINELKNDVFTIEWKWADNDNDTQIGKTEGANYKLRVKVNAIAIEN